MRTSNMKRLTFLLLLASCSMSELVDQPAPRTKADTAAYTPRQIDTLKLSDKPIGFDVSVEDWKENDN